MDISYWQVVNLKVLGKKLQTYIRVQGLLMISAEHALINNTNLKGLRANQSSILTVLSVFSFPLHVQF
ncbi:hypothetical protein CWO07_24800 [Vibrio splendidus]|uniref:Uncharacterized protein n=1 Tax=Vibrio splendidus TaxID=29497 RepID=A0A2T5EHB2_VIBSP|nr:hypothetical protein A148_12460 [Vibrio splendidus 1F-157]PMJ44651.1 hypothetical protein BCU23_26220 [Vibrio splendidus]PTP19127.1 hypothetical protein CWO07_24800 [Vibrio splendidus]PTP56971.1 hypothetical protein CWO23_25365 [Vibrio splendidus]